MTVKISDSYETIYLVRRFKSDTVEPEIRLQSWRHHRDDQVAGSHGNSTIWAEISASNRAENWKIYMNLSKWLRMF